MTQDLEDYIENHISPDPPVLRKIDRETNLRFLNGRMCSGHIQGRLLKLLIAMAKPKRVLELGTFTGYSALSMAEGLDEDASLDTIESNDEMEQVIRDNLNQSPYGHKINLHIGDAIRVMENWPNNEFDLALIDADKRQYPQYFKKLLKLVKPGGFILADNTLWGGHVTDMNQPSSQTKGILEFNDLLVSTSGIEIAIIPMRDGLTLIRKLP